VRDTITHTYSYTYFDAASYSYTQGQSNTKSSPNAAPATVALTADWSVISKK